MIGTVGEPGASDAFSTLTDSTGAEVTELAAGGYTVQIDDPSAIHNFHPQQARGGGIHHRRGGHHGDLGRDL